MARLVTVDGTIIFLGAAPTELDKLQALVGGYIEFVYLPGGGEIMCNEEGKLKGLPINRVATEMWYKADPRAVDADVLCGPIVFLTPEDAKAMKGGE
jgi:hypothetical protein